MYNFWTPVHSYLSSAPEKCVYLQCEHYDAYASSFPCNLCSYNQLILSKSKDSIDSQNLSDATTQEMKPVVRAKWKFRNNGWATCSNCGFTFSSVYDEDSADRYCRNCGAEMSMSTTPTYG